MSEVCDISLKCIRKIVRVNEELKRIKVYKSYELCPLE